MICQNCQKEISGDVKFCKFCGKEVIIANQSEIGSVDLYFQNKNEAGTEELKKLANSEILKGIGIIILGLVITWISYAMASDGGRYFIFWGISIYGGYVFLRGVYYRIFPS